MLSYEKITYLISLGVFVLIIFVLPFFSFEGYDIALNSISQLGGQLHPYNWVMNIFGFMLIGASVLLLYRKVSLPIIPKALIYTFGIAMIIVGLFKHEPVAGYGVANVFESNMHSIIANAIGISITIFALSLVFYQKSSKQYRLIAFLAAMVSSLFSLGMVAFPEYYGLIQRMMFISIFIWLFYASFEGKKVSNSST